MARVLVPLAEGCEELEAVTIIDLLRRARIEVVVAGLKAGLVKASRGTQIMPDTTLEAALLAEYDMVVLPGGMPGAQYLREDARVIALIQKMAAAGRYTAELSFIPGDRPEPFSMAPPLPATPPPAPMARCRWSACWKMSLPR